MIDRLKKLGMDSVKTDLMLIENPTFAPLFRGDVDFLVACRE